MSGQVITEIFIIGNEILIGDIQDTNTNWLCKEISNLGGYVSRATVLRDDEAVIAAEVRAAMQRGAEVIFTSGGLGPTMDDLTLSGIALGVGTEVQLNEQARRMINIRYDEMAAEGRISQGGMNPSREKMAWFPVGSEALHNPVGTACGVLLRKNNTTIISLPGIPSEMKGIFKSSLQFFLQETFGGSISIAKTILVRCTDETLMEPILTKVTKSHPKIYIKSLAKTCGAPDLKITFTSVGDDQKELESLIDTALRELQSSLSSIGISCEDQA